MTDGPISITARLKDDRRDLIYIGRTTAAALPFGRLSVIPSGAILFRDRAGIDHLLSDSEVTDIIKAFEHARGAADAWREKLSGANVIRVAKEGGEVRVTQRGRTCTMRISKLRRARHIHSGAPLVGRRCDACREVKPVLWVDATKYEPFHREPFVEVCDACVERLAGAREGIREVSR